MKNRREIAANIGIIIAYYIIFAWFSESINPLGWDMLAIIMFVLFSLSTIGINKLLNINT